MVHKIRLATLLLATTFLSVPCLPAFAHGHDDGEQARHSMMCEREHFTDAQKKLLHETMHRLHANKVVVHERMHKLHESLHAVLVAPSFDNAAFTSLTAQMASLHDQLKSDRLQAFASIAGQFTPEQREHLAMMFIHHHGHKGLDAHAAWHHEGMEHDGGRHHEGHEGWGHHETQSEGMSGVNQTTGVNIQKDYPPYSSH